MKSFLEFLKEQMEERYFNILYEYLLIKIIYIYESELIFQIYIIFKILVKEE